MEGSKQVKFNIDEQSSRNFGAASAGAAGKASAAAANNVAEQGACACACVYVVLCVCVLCFLNCSFVLFICLLVNWCI